MITFSARRVLSPLTLLFTCLGVIVVAQQFELPEPFATPSVANHAQVVSRPTEGQLELPSGFSIEVFADNLQGPRNMVQAPNGDLFVAESSIGSVVVLRDTDDDGLPDMRSTFIDGLSGVFGMDFHENYLYLGATDRIVRVPYQPGNSNPSGSPEQLVSLPSGGHNTRNLIFNRDGSKMYVAVGSRSNKSEGEEAIRAAISEYNPDGTGHRIFASGLRNPVGLAWQPGTDILWTAVNERDTLGDDLVPDYITSVQDGGFYGWPYSYIGTHPDPEHVGKRPDLVENAIVPDVLITAHSAALGVTFYEGTQFPERYRNGAFVALHGSWNRSTLSGYRVGFVPFEDGSPSGPIENFVTGWIVNASRPASTWGRPVGVLVSRDGSLLVADDGGDLIWRISFEEERTTETTFTLDDRGSSSVTTSGTSELTAVGYARIRPSDGNTTPSGVAIFGFTQNGVLVSEASVPSAAAIQEGRIFAEVNGPVNTGLAMANPNDESTTINFFFTDTNGTNFGNGSFELGANQQTAKFLDQEPFNGGSSVLGTFTFTSSVPISVIALRGFTNERSEFLMTTLPVAPLASTSSETVYFPHFVDGSGWTTQVVLVNPTDSTMTGTVQFLGQGNGTTAASPVTLMLDDGSIGSSFPYSIPPRSSQRFTTSNPTGTVSVGSVRAVVDSGNSAPSGLVIFSFASGGVTVSETGAPALPEASAFRVYVEGSGISEQIGSVRSGVAITTTSDEPHTVTLELTSLDGETVAAPAIVAIPPSGQVARFVDELSGVDSFTGTSLPWPNEFSGVLRITSTSEVAVVGLRLRINERSEIKMTTTPPSNEASTTTTADAYFPHIVDSGGWSTRFILFSGIAGQTSSGTLSFVGQDGQALDLSVN